MRTSNKPLFWRETTMKFLRKLLKYLLILLLIVSLLTLAGSYAMSYLGTANYPVRYGREIEEVAKEENLDPRLVAAIIKTESDFRADVIAKDGGLGLMQLMPETAKEMCKEVGIDYSEEAVLDPVTNIRLGCHHLASLIQKYQNRHLAAAAYNVGHTKVDQWLEEGTITWELESMKKIPVPITQKYVQKVDKAFSIYSVFYPDQLPEDTGKMNRFGLAWKNLRRTASWAHQKVK